METVELTPAPKSVQPSTSVLVSNISPSANEKTVSEFFSFCGKITNLKLTTYPNKGGDAIVVFETEAAAKTAVLLTNALIADRPITVVSYNAELEKSRSTNAAPEADSVTHELLEDKIQNKHHAVSDEERSKTSVIASMLAAGYVLGNDAIIKARDIDEQNQISQKAAAAAAAIKAKALEIDQQLQISATMSTIGTTIATKAQEVDQNYKISDNLNAAFRSVSDSIGAGVAMAQQSPAVQSTTQSLNNLGKSMNEFIAPTVGAVKANVEDIKQQTNQSIAEKQLARDTAPASVHPTDPSAPIPPPIPPKDH